MGAADHPRGSGKRSKGLYAALALALLGVVLAVVAAALVDDGEGDPQGAAALPVDDRRDPARAAAVLSVDRPEPRGVDTTLSNGWEIPERYKASLQVELDGEVRASRPVALETTVRKSALLPPCVTLDDGGLIPGGGYNVALPAEPAPNFSRTRPLNLKPGPGRANRFRIVFETPELEGVAALYEVDLAIRYRGSAKPLPLGRYLVMTPFTLHATDWKFTLAGPGRARQQANEQELLDYGPAEESLRCFRRNREEIAPFLASEADRTATMGALLEFIEATPGVA